MNPTRLYFLHRWIGVILGGLVFIWFASGIVLMYYPYPGISPARELDLLPALALDSTPIGFVRAHRAAAQSLAAIGKNAALISGRLERLEDRMVYRFQREGGDGVVAAVLVDARSGAVLSPVSTAIAEALARRVVGGGLSVAGAVVEQRADHYMMDIAYAAQFPAYRVQFDDSRHTAVYVGVQGGNAFGIVTRLTRVTTWTGTVPHWFYFIWLYDQPLAWSLAFVVTGSLVILLALTGIVWGLLRLLPYRSRGDHSLTAYRGVSRWHHLAGLVFGLLVLTWTASGLYQNFGPGNAPRAGQAARVRGGPIRWEALSLTELGALDRIPTERRATALRAVDLLQFDGQPGYEFHFFDGSSVWVDAASGKARGELNDLDRKRAAGLVSGSNDAIDRLDRITSYDEYYYARHGRQLPLPVWRASLHDRNGTLLYFDPVTGAPTGFVDRAVKRARWLRDGLHSLDFGFLNNHRPLWDLVMLPLLFGGLLVSGAGLILGLRRVRLVLGRSARRPPR